MFNPEGVAVNRDFPAVAPPPPPAVPPAASNIVPFPQTGSGNAGKPEKPSVDLRYAHAFRDDALMRIGGLTGASEGGVMDRTFHGWTENTNGEAYWRIYTLDDRNLHALEWLQREAPSKATERDAKSAASTASLLATGESKQWLNQTKDTVIGVRGAYLRIVREGQRVKLVAEKPNKDAGLTYVVPATFDWKRVAKDGTYTPRPVKATGRFGKYLARFLPDLGVRALLQEAVGSTVLNRAFEKCFWLQGEGSNGKSTLLHILRQLHPRNQALDLKHICDKFALNCIIGKTLATVSECPKFLGTDVEQKLKAIVSRDPIPTEEKWGGNLTFVPRVSLFMLFNNGPSITDNSYGFWSKVLAIPFSVQLPRDSEERITDYHKLITEDADEMSQVLDWVLEGALRLEARGNFPAVLPVQAQELARKQRHAADNVLQYLDANNAAYDANVRTLMPKVYEDYVKFCLETGVKAIQYNDFWTRTRDHFKPNELGHFQTTQQKDGKRPRAVCLRVDGVPVYVERAP
ncbi:MAG TPA: DUF5906 domain-containing protein [Hyphomonadaceae bacterium]|nr:DUF5906 domain-containing protein [Hyphomonadaceae bacterium]